MIKNWIRGALGRAGLEIRRTGRADSRWGVDVLRGACPPIRTCIDVGAGVGTPVLYEAFPEAYHLLVEPQADLLPALRNALLRYRGEIVEAAVGARPGQLGLQVDLETPLKSSFLERSGLTRSGGPLERRTVAMTTLDDLLDERRLEAPLGIKIDTEGYELEVLAGARRSLAQAAFVIAEVSYGRRFENGYSFPELTSFMARSGFYLHDVLQVVGPPVLYLDALFLRAPGASP